MKTQDLVLSLNYYVMNATKATEFLSTQPDIDKTRIARIHSFLKGAQDILQTAPETLTATSTLPSEIVLDFSEAKERSVAP